MISKDYFFCVACSGSIKKLRAQIFHQQASLSVHIAGAICSSFEGNSVARLDVREWGGSKLFLFSFISCNKANFTISYHLHPLISFLPRPPVSSWTVTLCPMIVISIWVDVFCCKSTMQGFRFSNAVSGGTDSNVGSLLLQHSSFDCDERCKLRFAISPLPQISTSVVERNSTILELAGM